MLELIAVFAIVLVALVVYYEMRLKQINNEQSTTINSLIEWIDYAESLETELDRIYFEYGDLKLNYGSAIVDAKIARNKVRSTKLTYTVGTNGNEHKESVYALDMFDQAKLFNTDKKYTPQFDSDGAIIYAPAVETLKNGNGDKAQSNGDKSKSENSNKNTPKTEAKSESTPFEHKDYQTVVNQLGGSVSEVESKSIKSQLDKGNDVKVIVGNIKKWRENNAKKIANK